MATVLCYRRTMVGEASAGPKFGRSALATIVCALAFLLALTATQVKAAKDDTTLVSLAKVVPGGKVELRLSVSATIEMPDPGTDEPPHDPPWSVATRRRMLPIRRRWLVRLPPTIPMDANGFAADIYVRDLDAGTTLIRRARPCTDPTNLDLVDHLFPRYLGRPQGSPNADSDRSSPGSGDLQQIVVRNRPNDIQMATGRCIGIRSPGHHLRGRSGRFPHPTPRPRRPHPPTLVRDPTHPASPRNPPQPTRATAPRRFPPNNLDPA